MNFKIIYKSFLIIALMVTLSACKHVNPRAGEAGGEAGGAQSYGVGDQAQFGQTDENGFVNGRPTAQVYYFPYDNSTVNNSYFNNIAAQAGYLKAHSGARIRLEGHTDERGSREYNIALGERRANAVKALLNARGVSNDQIDVISYGEEKPVALGHDESAYRLNRRVNLIYITVD